MSTGIVALVAGFRTRLLQGSFYGRTGGFPYFHRVKVSVKDDEQHAVPRLV